MSKEKLKFASEAEAMQYLSDITGKIIKVAEEQTNEEMTVFLSRKPNMLWLVEKVIVDGGESPVTKRYERRKRSGEDIEIIPMNKFKNLNGVNFPIKVRDTFKDFEIKELVGERAKVAKEQFRSYKVSTFSFEDGKFYSEGQFTYKTKEKAIRSAKELVNDQYGVVVWSDDYLIAFGGPNIDEKTAMKIGTNTVNRLIKKVDNVQKL